MDTKQLVEKFVNGEITEEQFDAETSKLSAEDQELLKKEAESKLPDAVEKLKGARRGIDKITEKVNKDNDGIAQKMRQENFEESKAKFFDEVGIEKDEDKLSFEEGFKKFDTGNVNVPNIIKDMKAYYASTRSDEFFDLKQKQKQAEEEADEYNAQNAGSNGSGGGEDPTKKISKEIKDFMEASRKAGRVITAEQAERAITVAKNKGRLS